MRDKNITVTVSTEAYRQARIWAAQHDTSISAVVEYLIQTPARNPARRARLSAAPPERSPAHSAQSDPTKLIFALFACETVKRHRSHSQQTSNFGSLTENVGP